MMRLAVIGFALALSVAPVVAAQFGDAQYAIKDDDGAPIANFDLGAELGARLAKLPG